MPGELQYLNLTDFRGGLNLYANQFQLADNESPDMMNAQIDTRVGFYARPGLQRMNGADIATTNWDPRHAETMLLSGGARQTFVTSNERIHVSSDDGANWAEMSVSGTPVSVTAQPHLADFAAWGNKTYVAAGPASTSFVQDGLYVQSTNEPTYLAAPGPAWNDDYTIPKDGFMPQAEVCEPHSGYLFTANMYEDLGEGDGFQFYPNRLRWSHPLKPEDWAKNDYIDIETGGGQITALMSFQDHLLIFKTDSMWALYGYETDSFQLIKMSKAIGVAHPAAVTRNETAVFLFSASDQGAVWAYSGGEPVEISSALRPLLRRCSQTPDQVFLGWMSRVLFLSTPCNSGTSGRSVYAWDPDVGSGAWTRFEPAEGEIRCVVERGDTIASGYAVFLLAGEGISAIARTNADIPGLDFISEGSPGVPFNVYFRTGWRDAGYPERRKSWRRPRFILSEPTSQITMQVATFQDYDQANQKRLHTLEVGTESEGVWSETGISPGFTWNSGQPWNSGTQSGSVIERVQPPEAGRSGLGVCAAVQLEINVPSENNPTGAKWGIDAIILKHRSRRGTT